KFRYRFGRILMVLAAAAIICGTLISYKTPLSSADTSGKRRNRFKPVPEAGNFVLTSNGVELICRDATPEESLELSNIPPDLHLKPIPPIHPNQQSGLKIVLMGTPQLDGFPQAKAAFVRAAANWEAIIGTPITIVINVDFGPTRFGTPFPQ